MSISICCILGLDNFLILSSQLPNLFVYLPFLHSKFKVFLVHSVLVFFLQNFLTSTVLVLGVVSCVILFTYCDTSPEHPCDCRLFSLMFLNLVLEKFWQTEIMCSFSVEAFHDLKNRSSRSLKRLKNCFTHNVIQESCRCIANLFSVKCNICGTLTVWPFVFLFWYQSFKFLAVLGLQQN